MKTIQEQLAEKASHADPQPVQYIGTVEAYDKWAEVFLLPSAFPQNMSSKN